MSIYKTVTKRGKNPLKFENLQPNGIYVVQHMLPVEMLPEWNSNSIEQWAIIQLDCACRIRRSWNLVSPSHWVTNRMEVSGLKVFRATKMEMDFARASEDAERMRTLYENERKRNIILDGKVDYYEKNRWHKLAEKIQHIFCV